MSGDALTIWSVRIALLLYISALFSWLLGGERRLRMTRALWSAGLLSYLAHVVLAFGWTHGFSHESAALETARQTGELLGVETSSGLWLNYLFTALWTADTLWWWSNENSYRGRPKWVTVSTHAFLAFMFFNGAVVFAKGFSRWVGLAATPPLVFLLLSRSEWLGGVRNGDTPSAD
jgi:hypothetical protein